MKRTALRAAVMVVFAALVAPGIAGAEAAKRPVTVPGSQPPPPPVVEEPTADAAAPAATPEGEAAPAGKIVEKVLAPEAKPVEAPPAAPAAFKDEREPTVGATVQKAVDPDPRELRYTKKSGEVLFTMTVRPGKPRPATPTEITFRIEELLAIPDPVVGDRRPIEKAKVAARVSGPEGTRTYELHALPNKGEYGFHFTPGTAGLYSVNCERVEGRPQFRQDFTVGVGVETPVFADDLDANTRKGSRVRSVFGGGSSRGDEAKGPDDTTASGVMDELGAHWMALRRGTGTPDATGALTKVIDQAKKLPGKVPAGFPESRAEFDRLAARFVADLEALQGKVTEAGADHELDRMQGTTCLRCHAQYRFGFAESVERWPDFDKRKTPLVQPASGTKATKRKLPIALPGKE